MLRSEKEKLMKIRLLEMGKKQKDVAKALKITQQDVSMVITGRSLCKRYIAAVHDYLGLEM